MRALRNRWIQEQTFVKFSKSKLRLASYADFLLARLRRRLNLGHCVFVTSNIFLESRACRDVGVLVFLHGHLLRLADGMTCSSMT